MVIQKDVMLDSFTSFRVGGPARLFCAPESEEELIDCLRYASAEKVEILLIGRGTNLLVSDRGFDGLAVYTGQLRSVEWDGHSVRAACGVPLAELAAKSVSMGLAGLEWAVGIPGALGGAVVMNAGAYGGEMSGVVLSSRFFDGKETREISDHNFSYRHSIYLEHPSFALLSATLRLREGDQEKLEESARQNREARRAKQPVNLPSAGSFFKRPPDHYAAALIDSCGLGGRKQGGAEVSTLHKGFIVNRGGASCGDILALARLVRGEVYQKTGVLLEPEVRLVGEEWNF